MRIAALVLVVGCGTVEKTHNDGGHSDGPRSGDGGIDAPRLLDAAELTQLAAP